MTRAAALLSAEPAAARPDGPAPTALATRLARAATAMADALALDPRAARLEAQVLAAHALAVSRAWLVAHGDEPPAPDAARSLEAALARRLAGEPVAYIVGWREFHGRAFRVTPDVLIPRPDTELLVETALAALPSGRPATILDLGTGSGCVAISLALERPDCRVTAVDVSPAALEVARDNAARLAARVEFLPGDWFSPIARRRFDLIVGNPPYVAEGDRHLTQGDLPREPVLALASGVDGLDAIRRILARARDHLHPGGAVLLEHGFEQGEAVRALLTAHGFAGTRTLTDLAGLPRCGMGRA